MPILEKETPYPDLAVTDKSVTTASLGYAVPVFIVTNISQENTTLDWSPVTGSVDTSAVG